MGIQFKDGEMSRIADPSACEEKLKCLERIANNKYYRVTDAEWPTSTGATKEELHILTSNEGIEYAKYLYDKSTVDRLRMSLSMAFSGSDADQSRSKSKD